MNFDALIPCDVDDVDVCVSPTPSWLSLLDEAEAPYPNECGEASDGEGEEEAAALAAARVSLGERCGGGLVFEKVAVARARPSRRSLTGLAPFALGEDGDLDAFVAEAPAHTGLHAALTAPEPEADATDDDAGDCASGETLTLFLPNGTPVDVVLREDVTVDGAIRRALHKVATLLDGGARLGRGADALGHGPAAAAFYELMLHDSDGIPDEDCPALERDRPALAFGTDELCLVPGATAPADMPDDRGSAPPAGAPPPPLSGGGGGGGGGAPAGPTEALTVFLPDRSPASIRVGARTTVVEAIALALGAAPPGLGLGVGEAAARCYELLLHDSDGAPDEDCPALERDGPALAFGEDELCLRRLPGTELPAAPPQDRRRASSGPRASTAFPRPSKTGLVSLRVFYGPGDSVNLKTDASWTIKEILPRVLRRRKMHNWGIPYGFRYTAEDCARLCYPVNEVCHHFTVGDLAMAGVFELELYCQTYAGGWYLDAPAKIEIGRVTPDPPPGSYAAREAGADGAEGGGPRPPDPADFQFNPATGPAYREWNVVKTNELGRRQERVLGIDGTKVYNTKRDKKHKLITATYKPSRRIENVVSLDILDTDANRRTVRLTFAEHGKHVVRDLELEDAKEAAHVVAKVRYNRAILLENKSRDASRSR